MRAKMKVANLFAAIAAICVLGFAMGLSYPLLSFQLDAFHYSTTMIGLSAASQPLGTIASLAATPSLTRQFGTKRVAISCAVLTATILMMYPALPYFWVWSLLRFAQGFLFSILFAISEAWIVEFATGDYRTRILSLYMSAFAAALAAGPLLIVAVGSSGWTPFMIGAAVLLAVSIPIITIEGGELGQVTAVMSVWGIVKRNVILACSVAVFAATEITAMSLLPIYAKTLGQTETRAALLVSVFVSGPILLQYPFAWLGDHMQKKHLLISLALLSAALYVLLSVMIDSQAVWLLLILLGVSTASLYTMSLSRLGEKYTGQDLVAGTAVFSSVYGFGSLAGSSLTGTIMFHAGAASFPFVQAALLTVLAVFTAMAHEI